MAKGRLTDAQLALATAFFRTDRDFFLTGGAVLAGWELQHRPTEDLDLFTDKEAVLTGERTLKAGPTAARGIAPLNHRSIQLLAPVGASEFYGVANLYFEISLPMLAI